MPVLPYYFNILFRHRNNVDKPVENESFFDVIFKILFKCLILMLSRCHCLNIALTFFPDIELIWIRQLELILFRRLFYNVDSMPDFHNMSRYHCLNIAPTFLSSIELTLELHCYGISCIMLFQCLLLILSRLPQCSYRILNHC